MRLQLYFFIIFFSFLSCNGPVKVNKTEKINNDSIFSDALREKITLKSFPENFFKLNGIDDWDSFEKFQNSVNGIAKLNPKSLAVRNLSIGNVVPAKAADPSGHSFNLLKQSKNLNLSLFIIS